MASVTKHSVHVTLSVGATTHRQQKDTRESAEYPGRGRESQGTHFPCLPPGLAQQGDAFRGDNGLLFPEEVEAIPQMGILGDGELAFNDSARLTPIDQVELQSFKLATPPLYYSNAAYSSPMVQHSSGMDVYSDPCLPMPKLQEGFPCPLGGLLPSVPYPVDTNGFTPLCTNPPLQPSFIPYVPYATPTQYEPAPLSFPITSPTAGSYVSCPQVPMNMFSYVQDSAVQIPPLLSHSLDFDLDQTSSGTTPVVGLQSTASMPNMSQHQAFLPVMLDESQSSTPRQTSIKPAALTFTLTQPAGPDYTVSASPTFSNEPVAPSSEPTYTTYERSLVLSFKDSISYKTLQQYLAGSPSRVGAVLDAFLQEYRTQDQMEGILIHPSGNYCFQRIIEGASKEQRLKILQLIQNVFFSICQNLHGTRSVQKLLEYVSSAEEKEIIARQLGTDNCVIKLIANINGNHCVQRCIETFSPLDCNFIYDQVIRDLVLVSTHQHGCCIIQRCLDLCNEEQRIRIVSTVCQNVMELIVDRFGNYVFQYSLEKASMGLCGSVTADDLIRPIIGREATLISQKFASHAVEKCLKHGSKKMRLQIINNIMTNKDFLALTMDRFGNYVIQRMFGLAADEQKGAIAQQILASPAVLGCNYSRHIVQMCEKYSRNV